jgi:uncharacterized membrane protein
MSISRKITAKNFLWYFLLSVILFFINFLGSLPCGLGLMVTLPYSACVVYTAYIDIFKPNTDNLEDRIEQFGVQDEDINTESQERNRSE